VDVGAAEPVTGVDVGPVGVDQVGSVGTGGSVLPQPANRTHGASREITNTDGRTAAWSTSPAQALPARSRGHSPRALLGQRNTGFVG
jgi:hypothetical protein